MADPPSVDKPSANASRYVVVARRYRPQSFGQLVGQRAAAQALQNAIASDRVGHAYLFTGARGVGKTSTARIFAKALNCVQGPCSEPCQQCDICRGIAEGHDVDVLEIDGASNRGIDEIRQLRSSVGIRPSRAKFKIYIIDEVHMLTREAFNALLKTLEEPPPHVKFFFCTTSPEKIPITVLSRCQRFDFPPIDLAQIVDRLSDIVAQEGATAEASAIEAIARRAAGSLRDSQSLLEQVLAFCGNEVTEQRVHAMLGTTSSQRILDLFELLTQSDAAAALQLIDQAMTEGVDAGQFAEQMLGQIRDCLAISVGGHDDLLLYGSRTDVERIRGVATAWGTEALMAAAQIIDQTLARMRHSLQGRTLLELATVRLARLDQLESLSALVRRLAGPQDSTLPAGSRTTKKKAVDGSLIAPTQPRASAPGMHSAPQPPAAVGQAAPGGTERRSPPADVLDSATPAAAASTSHGSVQRPANNGTVVGEAAQPDTAPDSWTDETAQRVWNAALESLSGMTADFARKCESVATVAPNRLVVAFPPRYNSHKVFCERPERRGELERALRAVAGGPVSIEFQLTGEVESPVAPVAPRAAPGQAMREVAQRTWVKRAVELFGAEIVHVDPPRPRD